MDCERANELIPLYLDQSLDDVETNELRTHLLKCKSCKQELIELEEVISKLQTMPKQALPLGYHEELMGKIHASANVQAKKKGMTPWMGAGVAAAVLAVAVYAGGGFDTMLQNKNAGIANEKNQEEIAATTTNDAMLSFDDSEAATGEETNLSSSEEGFENMDEVFVLDTAEADAATGSLPATAQGTLQGSVVSSVLPSDEEFIIIDDSSLAGGSLAGGSLAGNGTIVAPIVVADAAIETEPIVIDVDAATEPIIAEGPPQEAIQPVVPMESTQTALLSDAENTPWRAADNIVADTQPRSEAPENTLITANAPMIAESDIEVAWETIPEEETLTTENLKTRETAQPLEATPKMSENNTTQASTASIIETQPKESAIGLKNSNIVSISISSTNMQDVFQLMSDYVFDKGGMVLHEVLTTGISEPNAPIIPENRILFKIPKAVYETSIAELSKFGIINDYIGWEAPMDRAYEALKQERNILEKNGYQDLDAQLAEYDRRIATWEQEEEYTTVYLTVLENKSVDE